MCRSLTSILLILFTLSLQSTTASAQENEQWRAWNQPVEPFRIIGNIYYVGANDIGSFLIATPEGHILIDGGFPETAPLILNHVKKLGFRIEDVKILLNSHAHFDHSGGLAELQQASGAQVFIAEGDADLVQNGGRGDFLLGDTGLFPAVNVDRRLNDGDEVKLGGTTMTARITAGHTRGCTTWTIQVEEEGNTYDVVWVCSVTVLSDVKLTGEPSYPGIQEDFERSFEILKSLPCDVFLAPHGSFYRLTEKIEALAQNPETNPFIDPNRYRAYIERGERRFLEHLEAEQ